ncbi:DUF4403 family protein [Salinimicrobium flavum]|uniref:DUF4403 family protein n=1 Tax=Salinimicrobium flavum TaxID=1737065 RepID=A0ABW5IYE0_9FLAO
MENSGRSTKENVMLRLPVKIRYTAIERYLREKYIGEVLKEEKKDGEEKEYAEVLAISLGKSEEENFDLALNLQLRTLTSFFKNKILRVRVHLAMTFDPDKQEVRISDYQLEGENNSWLINKFLQVMANTFLFSGFRKKMKYDFRPLIEDQVLDLNKKLQGDMEVYDGINISGNLSEFRIADLIPGQAHLLISVVIAGNTVIDIEKINFSEGKIS